MFIKQNNGQNVRVVFHHETGIGIYPHAVLFEHGRKAGELRPDKIGRAMTTVHFYPEGDPSAARYSSAICDLEDQDNPAIGRKVAFAGAIKALKNLGRLDREGARGAWAAFFENEDKLEAEEYLKVLTHSLTYQAFEAGFYAGHDEALDAVEKKIREKLSLVKRGY